MAQLTNMKLIRRLSDESYIKRDGGEVVCARLLFQEQGSNYSKEFLTKWYGKAKDTADGMIEGAVYNLSANFETVFSGEKDYNKITCYAATQTSAIAQRSQPMAQPNGNDDSHEDLPF